MQRSNLPRSGAKDDKPSPSSPLSQWNQLKRRIPGAPFAKNKINLRNVGIVVVLLFIIRNFFRNDYRSQELNYIKDLDSVHRYVPKTAEEQQAYVNDRSNNVDRMKRDIAYLLQQVHELRTEVRGGRMMDREADLKRMDHIHMERRKEAEDKYLAEHPGAKLGRTGRLRGEDAGDAKQK